MLRAGDCVAVAVSGGADSVALLRLLHEMHGSLGVTLYVAHFNHQLRGQESDADQSFVASLAQELGLPFIVGRDDVARVAKEQGWNLEDAARRLRYAFFAKIVAEGGATHVATAHTADDQAETLLARLIRGTGLTGLASIHPVREHVIRPVLEVRRSELRNYLVGLKQEWREDGTNTDTRRLRARVRSRLLPEMEQNFSDAIVGKLCGLASLARDDEKFWAALVEERCRSMALREGEAVSIGATEILWPLGQAARLAQGESDMQNPFRALTQRIIRRVYAQAGASRGELSQNQVGQVIRLAERGASGKCVELPGGVRVRRQFDRLIFEGELGSRRNADTLLARLSYSYSVDLTAEESASVSIPELGKRFHLKVIDWQMRERETKDEGVVLDAERLRPPLILRNWVPGDAYCPWGRRRPQKLARMLIAGRVDAGQRAWWPVLTSEGRIAWADRMPPAAEFSTNEATQTGVWIFEDGG